jgi:hypothetical protein
MRKQIEDIILSYSARGIKGVTQALTPGYCERAAQLILENKGTVLIGTGFPVNDTFETDGPIGAISLYTVLQQLGYAPFLTCPPPLANVLEPDFSVCELPILPWYDTVPVILNALETLKPAVIVSIEQPGIARDGHYYNMRKHCLTDRTAKSDLFFRLALCPTIAIGDGGNEIGMGNVYQHVLSLPIIPSVTTCTELIPATVSNWGVYGLIAMISHKVNRDLFSLFDPTAIAHHVVRHGAIDGVTKRPEATEDGFPLSTGVSLIARMRKTLALTAE